VIAAPVFGALVDDNAEGDIISGTALPEQNVDHFIHHQPMQAAGAARLRLGWRAHHMIDS